MKKKKNPNTLMQLLMRYAPDYFKDEKHTRRIIKRGLIKEMTSPTGGIRRKLKNPDYIPMDGMELSWLEGPKVRWTVVAFE